MSNYNSQLQLNNTDLQMVLQTLQTKAAGGEQATPEISVSSNGLITATAGAKSSTHQLAFQPAKTVTPGIASQIAVSSGYFTGGDVMVAGDTNLVAGNIKSGVSIFGVSGTLVEGGGSSSGEQVDWSTNEDAMITRTLSSYFNDRVTRIGKGAFIYASNLEIVDFPNVKTIGISAFASCSKLTTVSFPVCTSIGEFAFSYCSKLTTASFPACTYIGRYAFQFCYDLTAASFPSCTYIDAQAFSTCTSLAEVSFPVCTMIEGQAFCRCSGLTAASFPSCTYIDNQAFYNCYRLQSLYLANSSVCNLAYSNAFSSTPYTGYSVYFSGTPYIYVPASLVSAYQTATNWTYYSSYFSAIEGQGSSLITFTISGYEYQAEEGMTWAEWVESEYNTNGYYNAGYKIASSAGTPIASVSSSDIIINNTAYTYDLTDF